LSIAERAAKSGNMEAKTPLLDDDVWPDFRYQGFLADDLRRTFHESYENIESPATQMYWDPVFLKKSL
jgi:hypothetical protein